MSEPTKTAKQDAGAPLADGRARPIDLSKPIQKHIIAAALRNPDVMRQVRQSLNPDFFEDNALSDIVAWSVNHWDEHRQVPSKAALLDVLPDLKPIIKQLFAEELPDTAHTVQRLNDYAHFRALRLAALKTAEIVNLVSRGEVPKDDKGRPLKTPPDALIEKTMRDALLVGRGATDLGEDIALNLDAGIAKILNPVKVEVIYTGLEYLDKAGVSLERGEVGCVLAATKVGKSHVLLNLAFGAAKQGYDVIFYTVEMATHRVRERVYRRVAGAKADQKVDPIAFVQLLRQRYGKLVKGRILVHKLLPRKSTPNDIRAHLTQAFGEGYRPAIIVIDYPGILKPDSPTGEPRHDLAQLWLDCRSIAAEFQVGVWGAAQANRGAVDKELVTMADIGECFEIVHHVDVGFAICMTQDEVAASQGRLFVFASRNEQGGVVIPFTHDWSRSLIKTTGLHQPEQRKRRSSTMSDDERSRNALDAAARRRDAASKGEKA